MIVFVSSFVLADVNSVFDALGSSRNFQSALSSANLFSMYLLFILAGYFIAHKQLLSRMSTPFVLSCFILSFAAFCAFQFWFYTKVFDHEVSYSSVFCVVPSIFLFELLRRLRYWNKLANIAAKLSRISFGIYFVHICIMHLLYVGMDMIKLNITYLPKLLVLEAVSFAGSIIVILILSRIQWIKKNLFVIK